MLADADRKAIAIARRWIAGKQLAEVRWRALAAELGIGRDKLKRALVPGYGARRNAVQRRSRRAAGEVGLPLRHCAEDIRRATPAEAARRLAEIPPDVRSLTARILGDPLPGRRAIDLEPRGWRP